MAVRTVIKSPNPLLKQKSSEIEVIDKGIKQLVKDMFDTMKEKNGIGLAGVQIGVLKRIIVVEINEIGFKSELINPKIVSFSNKKTVMTEGCLSVPDRTYAVERPEEVEVEYFTVDKEKHKIKADGLLAKCLQHEIDHLNGITIIDRGTLVEG